MDFGKQIKKIRTDRGLTQEQMAGMLNVSRQAISNWENNKNLPDLELIILMSRVFSMTLDELILGGNEMNNMTAKLIQDGSEGRRDRFNFMTTLIGAILLCIGLGCFIAKMLSPEYVDDNGLLHEAFYLIPIGFLFVFSSMITFSVLGVRKLVKVLRGR